jgi:hypothetical protein
MLFARTALASGPQAWFGAEKGFLKVKVGKPLSLLTSPRDLNILVDGFDA